MDEDEKDIIENYASFFGAFIALAITGTGMIIAEFMRTPFPSWGVLGISLSYWALWVRWQRRYDETQMRD